MSRYIVSPWHPHCGYNANVSPTASSNVVDEVCRQHDMLYQEMIDEGYDPYDAYNEADTWFINEMDALIKDPNIRQIDREVAHFAKTYFQAKEKLKQPMRRATRETATSRKRWWFEPAEYEYYDDPISEFEDDEKQPSGYQRVGDVSVTLPPNTYPPTHDDPMETDPPSTDEPMDVDQNVTHYLNFDDPKPHRVYYKSLRQIKSNYKYGLL